MTQDIGIRSVFSELRGMANEVVDDFKSEVGLKTKATIAGLALSVITQFVPSALGEAWARADAGQAAKTQRHIEAVNKGIQSNNSAKPLQVRPFIPEVQELLDVKVIHPPSTKAGQMQIKKGLSLHNVG